MARIINRLNARAVDTLTRPGRHADGGGLYLSISPNGGRRWTFLYRWHGKPTEIGFGSARDVPLAYARELAAQARKKLAAGENPKQVRRSTTEASFGACAERLIAAMRPSWRNAEHARQWETTLRRDAAALSHLPVDKISTEEVLGVLQPLWLTKPVTASRLRGRIERVLDAAKAKGLRPQGVENPARWRGHLDQLLPRRPRLQRAHHAAMGYVDVPGFMLDLQGREGVAARALEFTILTAARTGEVLGARTSEFDLAEGIWRVPAARMKGGRPHSVPLSRRALEIVTALHEERQGEFVFPGQKRGQPLSGAVLKNLLRRMKVGLVTVHGFRSSFRDWAADTTHFSHEACEAALAHTIGSAVERAYRRTDLFEKRRQLMEAWAAHCALPVRGKVLAFRR